MSDGYSSLDDESYLDYENESGTMSSHFGNPNSVGPNGALFDPQEGYYGFS